MWTFILGILAGVSTAPCAPTSEMSCLERLMTAKYCGKSMATTATVRSGSCAAAAAAVVREGDDDTEEVVERLSQMESWNELSVNCK